MFSFRCSIVDGNVTLIPRYDGNSISIEEAVEIIEKKISEIQSKMEDEIDSKGKKNPEMPEDKRINSQES